MLRHWDEMMEEIRSFIQDLLHGPARKDYERPWGLMLRRSQQLFWMDRWLDRVDGGQRWVKDLQLVMENLAGRLEALDESDWTDQFLTGLEALLTRTDQLKTGQKSGHFH
jgi:hypothetical protein